MLSSIRASFKKSAQESKAPPRRWSKLQILFICIYGVALLRISSVTLHSKSFAGPPTNAIAVVDEELGEDTSGSSSGEPIDAPAHEVARLEPPRPPDTVPDPAPLDRTVPRDMGAAPGSKASEDSLASLDPEEKELTPPPELSPSEQRAWRLRARRKLAAEKRRRARSGALEDLEGMSVVQRVIERDVEPLKPKTITPQTLVWAATDALWQSSQREAGRTADVVFQALPQIVAAARPQPVKSPAEETWATQLVTAQSPPDREKPRYVVIHNPSVNQGVVRFLVDGREVSLSAGEERRWPSEQPITISYHRGGTLGDADVVAEQGSYQFSVSRRGWRLDEVSSAP